MPQALITKFFPYLVIRNRFSGCYICFYPVPNCASPANQLRKAKLYAYFCSSCWGFIWRNISLFWVRRQSWICLLFWGWVKSVIVPKFQFRDIAQKQLHSKMSHKKLVLLSLALGRLLPTLVHGTWKFCTMVNGQVGWWPALFWRVSFAFILRPQSQFPTI